LTILASAPSSGKGINRKKITFINMLHHSCRMVRGI
jgi:hypothetical protein